MIRNDFCIINENIPRRHRRTNSQFLKHVMHEAEKSRAVRAHEILMTSENPMIKEQKLSDQICSELEKLEREKFLKEKRKVLLHRNEDEIRELDVHIKRANIQRQLVEQKAFREDRVKEEVKARLEENKRFEEECKRNMEITLKEEIENEQRKAAFRQDLLKQMQEKDKQRELQKKIIEKERTSRQKYLESIQKDIESEQQDVVKLKEMLRQDRDKYLQQVKAYKSKTQYDAEDDHKKYIEIAKQREEYKRLRKENRKQELQERAALSERIGQQVFNLNLEKQKRDDVLMELLIEERLAKEDKRHKANLEKQRQRARSLRADFEMLFTARQQEILLKREQEKSMTQGQLKIFENQEKTENINELRKHYRQDLLETIEFKQWQRELEAAQNKAEYEKQMALKNQHQDEIEAEKLRLLRAQPIENLKFLPRKAISKEHRSVLGLTCKERKENK